MSKYVLMHGTFVEVSDEELCHYGVLGMKWGVRRATKQLQKVTTSEQRDKAVASLNKHRAKASKKIDKLSAKRPKLENKYTKAVIKLDPKIAKLERKKARLARRANSIFTSDKKTMKLLEKTRVLNLKIDSLRAKSNTAKVELAKNERMTSLFKQGVSDIDSALASAGRKYVNG